MEVWVIYVCTVLVSGDSRLPVCSLERNVQVNFFPLSASPPRGIYRHSSIQLYSLLKESSNLVGIFGCNVPTKMTSHCKGLNSRSSFWNKFIF